MATSLYICYFGLNEPLVQTQVLPYIREIIKGGVDFTLLTFEPEGRGESDIAAIRERLAAEGIEWHHLRYHKTPTVPATAYDIFRGTLFTWNYLRKHRVDIIHGRVHIPQLMGTLARKLSRQKPKLLFDIRGFFPEEYTDAGRWPENGWLYKAAKRVERWLLKESDGFVVLTEKARDILFPESRESGLDRSARPVAVIPCCVDLNRFTHADSVERLRKRLELGIDARRVITYVGSFGGWYLTEEMIDFIATALINDPSSFAMILTQRDEKAIKNRLNTAGLSENAFLVMSVRPDEIPSYVCTADIAISFIKPCFSKLSSSPTKIAEYLACGVPIIANPGVGDVAEMIGRNGVGVILAGFSRSDFVNALQKAAALGDVSRTCRSTASREFSLERIGGPRYRSIYQILLKSRELCGESFEGNDLAVGVALDKESKTPAAARN